MHAHAHTRFIMLNQTVFHAAVHQASLSWKPLPDKPSTGGLSRWCDTTSRRDLVWGPMTCICSILANVYWILLLHKGIILVQFPVLTEDKQIPLTLYSIIKLSQTTRGQPFVSQTTKSCHHWALAERNMVWVCAMHAWMRVRACVDRWESMHPHQGPCVCVMHAWCVARNDSQASRANSRMSAGKVGHMAMSPIKKLGGIFEWIRSVIGGKNLDGYRQIW